MKDDRSAENARPLSEAEQRRKAVFEALSAQMEAEGWRVTDLTVGIVYANVMAFVLAGPLCLLMLAAFVLAVPGWAGRFADSFGLWQTLGLLAAYAAAVVLHELLHGLVWALFVPGGWKNIEFGIMKEYATPYCTCGKPMGRLQYTAGALAPTLVLGILPGVCGVLCGSAWWLMLGVVMTLAGGGDLTILLKLWRHRPAGRQVLYLDHPWQAGLVAFER